MRTLFLCIGLFCIVVFGVVDASAQCDRNTNSPIRCGYYDEGYQDGMSDANSNRRSDYRRYRSKLDSQYEDFYSRGYSAGFDSVRPGGNTYPPIAGGGGNASGTASWSGRVDDRANIIVRGGTIRSEDVSGTGLQVNYQNMNGSLPRRGSTVTATKRSGRGDVRVIQQPSRSNDYTAIIHVSDTRSGSDNYTVDISWDRSIGGGNQPNEPYRAGSVRWHGRVDQTANIRITGNDVQTEDASGTGISNVDFSINGSLARRPGTVTARKRSGRGSVTVTQQPSWDNDFTAIVQVFDPGGGADNYDVDITW
jgi:hypothetical protein